MGQLDGKVAIITGTSAGIGKATAIRFAEEEMAKNALKRCGHSYEDCAGVCVFLAGPDSRFITGQSIHVEGGAWMGMA